LIEQCIAKHPNLDDNDEAHITNAKSHIMISFLNEKYDVGAM
jgi:hypothetical protein